MLYSLQELEALHDIPNDIAISKNTDFGTGGPLLSQKGIAVSVSISVRLAVSTFFQPLCSAMITGCSLTPCTGMGGIKV